MNPLDSVRTVMGIVGFVAIIGAALWIRSCGKDDVKADINREQIKVVGQAIEISHSTEIKVNVEQFETTKAAAAATAKIDRIIEAAPVGPSDPFGVVLVNDGDLPDILRIAQEARLRAVLASCRVQRTSDCDPVPGAAKQR